MTYPKNPYCPFDNDCICPGNGNNGGNNNGESNTPVNPENGNNTSGMSKEELLKYISEIEFAITDINLYLDTHPNNSEALEIFTKLSATLKSIMADYAKRYGPLCVTDVKNEVPFEWVSSKHKWPWQL